ncbi:hypothetical protein K492DRAFT_123659 [Lichtheimia hyalospora FSU 10163]|nr:hypothetical protein K492DRAFT_123659 [Lichtheimia hyalospora FSU 10163]
MAFKFNFTSDDLDLDEIDQSNQLNSSLNDLSLEEQQAIEKTPCYEYDITTCTLPSAVQADILDIPHVNQPLYKRSLGDVKYQMAMQDTLGSDDAEEKKIVNMLDLNSNSDLVRGVYEGGFKTWECSLDLTEYLAKLPKEQVTNKRVLELGCGSALPSLFLLQHDSSNHVDVLDYNEQVIQYITLPNILLNTVLQVHTSTDEQPEDASTEKEKASDKDEKENDDDQENDDDDEEKDQIIGESVTCDAEAELPSEHAPDMLQRISQRTRAFVGDWSGLPVSHRLAIANCKYDMIVTSETIYSQDALHSLVQTIQKTLKKPDGVW